MISGYAIIGENLTLVGGNCIGARKPLNFSELILGNDVYVGANAVILGPVKIGNNVKIGAGAVVTKSIPDNVIVGGVPERVIKSLDE